MEPFIQPIFRTQEYTNNETYSGIIHALGYDKPVQLFFEKSQFFNQKQALNK